MGRLIRKSRKRLIAIIIKFLKQGITPERLALSISLGITVGIIPLIGVTTIIISAAVFSLRLNFAAAQLVHYVVHPIQIALFIPFIKLGEIFHSEALLPGSFLNLLGQAKADLWGTIHDFWVANLSALGIWTIIALPMGIILYRVSLAGIRQIAVVRSK